MQVTAVGVATRSVQDVKDKRENMQSLAKKEYTAQKKVDNDNDER